MAPWKDRGVGAMKIFPPLPPWTWRNVIAVTALVFTILGAAILTTIAWWLLATFGSDADRLINELVRDPKARPEVGQVLVMIYETMSWGLKLLLAGVIIVLLSLGLAITQRRFKGEGLGGSFEFSGGDTDGAAPAAAQAVAASAQDTADQITEEARP